MYKHETRTQPDNPKPNRLIPPLPLLFGWRLAPPQDPAAARLTPDGRRPEGEAEKRAPDGATPLALALFPYVAGQPLPARLGARPTARRPSLAALFPSCSISPAPAAHFSQRFTISRDQARWWTVHGTSAKDLKKMAIRILSLTCSSSACERNWSAFERVHSKKRTRLGQKKLNDLVYVMFNKRLDSKYSERERDPLVAKYIEDAPPNEWMLDEELLQDDEASEDEAEVANNLKRKQKSVASRTRGKRACTTADVEEEDEEEEAVEEEEMEEEEENQEAKEDSDGEDQEVDIDLTLEEEEDGE